MDSTALDKLIDLKLRLMSTFWRFKYYRKIQNLQTSLNVSFHLLRKKRAILDVAVVEDFKVGE